MKILGKSGNEVLILSTPSEQVHQGDYLQLEDTSKKINILAQIYEETYIDIPGLSEEILRDEVIESTLEGIQGESLEIENISMFIRDSRILKCKIRGMIKNSTLTYSNNSLPSRVYTKIKKISYNELFEIAKREGKREIELGTGASNEIFKIYAEALDGKLNIITGKKESGKSHLSKLLAANLAELGAPIIIFDLNDEYKGLTKNKNGTTSNLSRKITRLVPGKSLKFNLQYLELNCLCNILTHSLQLPGASLREFLRIFKLLKTKNSLNIDELRNHIFNWKGNEFVRDALISRFHTLQSTGILTDNNNSIKLEELLNTQPDGNIIIISLSEASPLLRRITVEIILSKLVNLLEKKDIKPVFLFAEEAHLYLRDTYWDDIITRIYALPERYGNIAKAYVVSDDQISSPPGEQVSFTNNQFGLNIYLLGYDKNRKLTNLNSVTKQNLKTYLGRFRMLTDAYNIKNAYIVNIGVKFDILVKRGYNKNEVLLRAVNRTKEYFNIDTWQVNQPIVIAEVLASLLKVEGVLGVEKPAGGNPLGTNIVFENKYDTTKGYSGNVYDLTDPMVMKNGIIYTSKDPSIFEVKYPTTDIVGRVIGDI